MKKVKGNFPRYLLGLTWLAFAGRATASGVGALSLPFTIGFPSQPIVVEAEGMGNAVVADGSLFNATAYNPALLANNADTFEMHLGFNLGNDIFGMADYLFNYNNFNFSDLNTNNIKNLQNSIQGVNAAVSNMQGAISMIGAGSTNASAITQEFNNSAVSIQNAVNNINQALNEAANKTIQVGAGLNVAFKIDDHFGFQAYNTTQVAVQVGRGSLITDLQNLTLPNLSGITAQNAQAAAVSFYNNAQPLINSFLTSSQITTLSNAVSTLENTTPSDASVSQFASTVSSVLTSVAKQAGEQVLFNDIAPIEVLTFSDTVLMGTYCTRPLEDDKAFSIGVNLKAVNRHIASVDSEYLDGQNLTSASDIGNNLKNDLENDIKQNTWRWGLDLGVLYDFDDPQVSVGASATDLLHSTATLNTSPGDPLYGMVTDPAPTDVRIGASYKPIRELTVNADIDDLLGDTSYYEGLDAFSHVDFGFNYNLWGILQLRGGVTNDNLCGGLGLPLGIQYAFAVDTLTQSYNHYLQFDVAF